MLNGGYDANNNVVKIYKQTDCNDCLRVGTWNVISLNKNKERVDKLCEYVESKRIDVLGLTETKLRGNGKVDLPNGIVLYYSGSGKHQQGVGLLLNKRVDDQLRSIQYVSDRIIIGRFKITKTYITIVVVYAPTNITDLNDSQLTKQRDDFYKKLQQHIDRVDSSDLLVLVGDFNAKIGKDNVGFDTVMGQGGTEKLCDNGKILKDFCLLNGLVIGGSLFEEGDEDSKATWWSNDGTTKNQIDHIIVGRKWIGGLKRVEVDQDADIGSDHRMLKADLSLKSPQPTTTTESYYTFNERVTKNKLYLIIKKENNHKIIHQNVINITNFNNNKNNINENENTKKKKNINLKENDNTKKNNNSNKNNKSKRSDNGLFFIKRISANDIRMVLGLNDIKTVTVEYFNLILKTKSVPVGSDKTNFLKIVKHKLRTRLLKTLPVTSNSNDYTHVLRSILKKSTERRQPLYMNFITIPFNIEESRVDKILKRFGIADELIQTIGIDPEVFRSEILSILFYMLLRNTIEIESDQIGIPWVENRRIGYIQYDENVCLLSDKYDQIQNMSVQVCTMFNGMELSMKLLKVNPDGRNRKVNVNGTDLVEYDTVVLPSGIISKTSNRVSFDKRPYVINFHIQKLRAVELLEKSGWNGFGTDHVIIKDMVSLTSNNIYVDMIRKFYNDCIDKMNNRIKTRGNKRRVRNRRLRYIDDKTVEKMILIEKLKWIVVTLHASDDYVVKQVLRWNRTERRNVQEKLYNTWRTELNRLLKKLHVEWDDLKTISGKAIEDLFVTVLNNNFKI